MDLIREAIGEEMAELHKAVMASRGEEGDKTKSIWDARARHITQVGKKPISVCNFKADDPRRGKLLVLQEGELEDDDEWAVLGMNDRGYVYWFIYQVNDRYADYRRCERMRPDNSSVSTGQLYAAYTAVIDYIDLVHQQSRQTEQFRGDTAKKAHEGRTKVDRAIRTSPLLL